MGRRSPGNRPKSKQNKNFVYFRGGAKAVFMGLTSSEPIWGFPVGLNTYGLSYRRTADFAGFSDVP